MKINVPRWPGRASTRTAPDAPDAVLVPPVDDAAGVVTTMLMSRLVSAVIAACLAAGPVALAVGVLGGGTPAVAPPAVAAPGADDPVAAGRVGEFALDVVVATVSGSRETKPAAWVAAVGSGERSLAVSVPVVVSTVRSETGVWSVTVAASVSGKGVPAARRFFMVPVTDQGGVLRAVAGVAQVAGPSYGEPARPEEYPERVVSGPVVDAIAGFASALLTGSGEVGRYTAPGSPVTAIVPAPYTQVTVADVLAAAAVPESSSPADGTRLRVLASVTATTAGYEVPLSYALTLTSRAGRWEVSRLDPSPVSRPPASSSPGASGASSASLASSTK